MKTIPAIVAAVLAFFPTSCIAEGGTRSKNVTQLPPIVTNDVVTVVFKDGLPPVEKLTPQQVKAKEIRMAVEVVGARKNGWLELHGRRETFANGKIVRLDIKGIVRPESVDSTTRTVYSDSIAELQIATLVVVANQIAHSSQSK